jgi:hypothetical protein
MEQMLMTIDEQLEYEATRVAVFAFFDIYGFEWLFNFQPSEDNEILKTKFIKIQEKLTENNKNKIRDDFINQAFQDYGM